MFSTCRRCRPSITTFFFFNDTATTEIYTLSLHDALPISDRAGRRRPRRPRGWGAGSDPTRSEEHTSELQSHLNLVCRLLLEKKKGHCRPRPGTSTATLAVQDTLRQRTRTAPPHPRAREPA